jgi:hypothetical protein
MTGRFLLLVNTPNERPAFLADLRRHRFDVVQQYELDRLDLDRFSGIVLTMHSDQVHLSENAAKLDAYLDGGGSVIFNGHVVQPFLPELTPFRPLADQTRKTLRINREAEHPLFGCVTSDDLSFQRGVMGFYGRGTNPPPAGAVVLNSAGPERAAVDWLLTRPTGGRLFVHTGDDLFSFLSRAGSERLSALQQFFDWFVETDHAAPRRH